MKMIIEYLDGTKDSSVGEESWEAVEAFLLNMNSTQMFSYHSQKLGAVVAPVASIRRIYQGR